MAESLSDEQLAELRDRCTAEVWFGLSREEARALLADNERLQAAVQLLGTNLQGSARDFVDALAEVERLQATLANARGANRRLRAALIASAHLLDVPYSNAPNLTPWERSIKPAMHALKAALDGPAVSEQTRSGSD